MRTSTVMLSVTTINSPLFVFKLYFKKNFLKFWGCYSWYQSVRYEYLWTVGRHSVFMGSIGSLQVIQLFLCALVHRWSRVASLESSILFGLFLAWLSFTDCWKTGVISPLLVMHRRLRNPMPSFLKLWRALVVPLQCNFFRWSFVGNCDSFVERWASPLNWKLSVVLYS